MAEKSNSDLGAVMVIVVISTVCAVGLAMVKSATAERIKESKAKAETEAIAKVLPEGCEAKVEDKLFLEAGAWVKFDAAKHNEADKAARVAYPAFKGSELCGIALKTKSTTGYSGVITLLVGYKNFADAKDMRIHRIFVLEQNETPGLGAKIVDGQSDDPETWKDQPLKVFGANFWDRPVVRMTFEVKKPAEYKPFDPKGQAKDIDVAAITASTISSKAVTLAVKEGTELVTKTLDGLRKAATSK